MKKIIFGILTAFLILCSASGARSQDSASPILFIYDASGSMWGQLDGKTKMTIAAEVLSSAVEGLPDNRNVGFMAYGHRREKDCTDVEIIAGLDNTSKEKVVSAVKAIKPLGRTPLAYSATLAIDNVKASGNGATIILVTDGIESCDGDICDVVRKAKEEGIDFKLHIVGFGLKDTETEQLRCAASEGGGRYYDASDAAGLSDVLNEAIDKSVDKPDGNLTVFAVKNGQPVDAWVRAYKAGTKTEVDYDRTYRDTARIFLPSGRYEVSVQPLENTDVTGTMIIIDMNDGQPQHRTVSFDAAKIGIYTSNNGEGWDAMVKLIDKSTGKTAAAARTYGKSIVMEVNPGIYHMDLEAMRVAGSDAKTTIDSIIVDGGQSVSLTHNFITGKALVGVITGGELVDATVTVTDAATGASVDAGRTYRSESSNPRSFILTAGNYTVKIVTLGIHKGYTETFNIEVPPSGTVEKIISY